MKFFGAKEFFYVIFEIKNGCKNEFKDNNEKSCSWSRKRDKGVKGSRKIWYQHRIQRHRIALLDLLDLYFIYNFSINSYFSIQSEPIKKNSSVEKFNII